MTTFLSPYNPQDPPKILFKGCKNCQEIAIITNVKYTDEQLLMNVINLLTMCELYQCNLKDWDHKPDANKTWHNLLPFIQEGYQHHFQSGRMTPSQEGYASQNHFASFSTTTKGYVSNNYTAKTIPGTINSHFTKLSAQMAA
jgi:hypothetical protein